MEHPDYITSANGGEVKPVLFSGLTASSKTFYSRLFAKISERPWFDAMTELKNLADVDAPNQNIWASEHAETIQRSREGDDNDRLVDQMLLERLAETPNAVVDAWAMPWLWRGDAVRVFMEADFETRVQRAMASSAEAPGAKPLSEQEAIELVAGKDNYTRELFMRLYGFDIFTDRQPFDVVVDTSGFEPDTPEMSGSQIAKERLAPIAFRAILLTSGQIEPDAADVDEVLKSSKVQLNKLILPVA